MSWGRVLMKWARAGFCHWICRWLRYEILWWSGWWSVMVTWTRPW